MNALGIDRSCSRRPCSGICAKMCKTLFTASQTDLKDVVFYCLPFLGAGLLKSVCASESPRKSMRKGPGGSPHTLWHEARVWGCLWHLVIAGPGGIEGYRRPEENELERDPCAPLV